MPSITINDINTIKESLNDTGEYPYFVETGTHIGNSLSNLKNYFKKLRSVELLAEFYNQALYRKTNEYWFNVELYHGDSSQLLPYMLKGLDENIIFFLDGHRSGGDADAKHKDCPLLEELSIIRNLRGKYSDLIIIDDFRLFGTSINEDWKDITIGKVATILENKSYYELNDRVIITNKN